MIIWANSSCLVWTSSNIMLSFVVFSFQLMFIGYINNRCGATPVLCVRQILMRCQRIVQRINSHCHQGSTNEQRLTKNIVSSLARSLQDLSSNFRRAQSSYLRSIEFLWRPASMYYIMLRFCEPYLTASWTIWVQLFSCILLSAIGVIVVESAFTVMPYFILSWS